MNPHTTPSTSTASRAAERRFTSSGHSKHGFPGFRLWARTQDMQLDPVCIRQICLLVRPKVGSLGLVRHASSRLDGAFPCSAFAATRLSDTTSSPLICHTTTTIAVAHAIALVRRESAHAYVTASRIPRVAEEYGHHSWSASSDTICA